jgi:hypothetical protein
MTAIMNDEQLNQSVEQLARLYRALAALRKDVLPVNANRFALMAEGPQDEIRRLQKSIDEYVGRNVLAEHESDVWLRILGPELQWPDAPTSVLTAFLDAFRKGVQAVAEFNTTGHLTTRPTKELKRACDLRVVAFQAGSLCVGVRVPEDVQMVFEGESGHHPVYGALKQYLLVAEWVASEQPPAALEELITDSQKRRLLLNAVKPFVPRPRGDVESVEVSSRWVSQAKTIQLTRASHQRIDLAIDQIAAECVETHVGDLREVDLDNLSFILRNAEDVREVRCAFDEDLLETAKEALDRRVQVTGIRRLGSGRRVSPTLRVIRLEILDEEPAETVSDPQPAPSPTHD